jgi:hypothetical protein
MTLVSAAPSSGSVNRGVNLAWDGTGTVSLHAITFRNLRFEGGDMGCGIGDGQLMGSEILFIGCDFVGCMIGTKAFNYNALDMTILGGSFQNCGTGIDCNHTSTYSYVSGVAFSNSRDCDILFDSYDGMIVEACSSNSTQFFNLIGSVPLKTKACLFAPSSSGYYAICQAFLIMDGCIVSSAVLQGPGALDGNAVYLRGCQVPANFISGATKAPPVKENI